MTHRMLAFAATSLLLAGQAGMATAQTSAAQTSAAQTSAPGTATNQTALGVPADPGQPGYCAPNADGTPADCDLTRPVRHGAFGPGTVPVLLGAVGAVGVGIAAATSGGGRDRTPVSP